MTIEELRERHASLVYFNDDLKPKGDIDWTVIRDNPELMAQMIADMMYVNRMNTIARNKEWVLLNAISPFKSKMMKQRLIGSKEANEFGEVANWGSRFEDEEEWDVYEKHYDELFETSVVE